MSLSGILCQDLTGLSFFFWLSAIVILIWRFRVLQALSLSLNPSISQGSQHDVQAILSQPRQMLGAQKLMPKQPNSYGQNLAQDRPQIKSGTQSSQIRHRLANSSQNYDQKPSVRSEIPQPEHESEIAPEFFSLAQNINSKANLSRDIPCAKSAIANLSTREEMIQRQGKPEIKMATKQEPKSERDSPPWKSRRKSHKVSDLVRSISNFEVPSIQPLLQKGLNLNMQHNLPRIDHEDVRLGKDQANVSFKNERISASPLKRKRRENAKVRNLLHLHLCQKLQHEWALSHTPKMAKL